MKEVRFARTKKGIIKIDPEFSSLCEKYESLAPLNKMILKVSTNIVDLIKIGDFVNKCRVIDIEDDVLYVVGDAIYKHEIKSILTKEEFENREFKL